MGRLERWLRLLLYFPCLFAIFVGIEVGFRVWAMPFRAPEDPERIRRFNLLTRWWGCSLSWITRTILGVRTVIRGERPPGRHVILSNHQSTADIAFLMAIFAPHDLKFVAKRSLGRGIPSVSTYLVHGGAALISRDESRDDLKALKRLGAGLERWDASAVVFAEGTRTEDGELGRFRSAAARVVARESGLDWLPLCIEGSHVAKTLPDFIRGMAGARIVFTIGEPRPAPRGAAECRAALDEIEDWVRATIESVRAEE